MDEILPLLQKGTPGIQPIVPTEPLNAAKPEDLKLFQDAMKGTTGPQGAFDSHTGLGFDPTLRGKTPMAVDSTHSGALGDAILKGIQATSDQYHSTLANVRMSIHSMGKNPASMTPTNLLSMQVNLMQLGTHIDIASKIAGKLNQGVQTLFKNQ